MAESYDALLVVSFGGPEGPADVLPFLENVLRGKNVPRERMLEVAEHYRHFGGVSPLTAQNRQLIAALEQELDLRGPQLPIYWGNRNWHPLLPDTLAQMARDGVRRAISFFTSAYSSYSGCRQYREDIERARQQVGLQAPRVDKLRVFYNHPGFIQTLTERMTDAVKQIPAERRGKTHIVYTAHSIPQAMASNCRYEAQLTETARLVSRSLAEQIGASPTWRLAYQSRSGPASQPWLEPDICDYLRELQAAGNVRDVVVSPIGFLSDHMEILFDLDTQARDLSQELGLNMIRAATVGDHPRFVAMIRELIQERVGGEAERPALGEFPASHDICPADCCLPAQRPAARL